MLISFIRYKIFEKKLLNQVQSNFSVITFGDKGLQDAFESFFKNNQEIPIGFSEANKISRYFAHMEDTDGRNKVNLFAYFIWDFVLENGRIQKVPKLAKKKVDYALNNMKFIERNGYKVISHKLMKDFYQMVQREDGK